MMDSLYEIYFYLSQLWSSENRLVVALTLFPMVVMFELPFYVLLIAASLKKWLMMGHHRFLHPYSPTVTVAITAYSEKEGIYITLATLYEQRYAGKIEVLVIIDGGLGQNFHTTACARQFVKHNPPPPHIEVKIIPKRTRGGVAHSRNLALRMAKGEVFVILDADTSLENMAIAHLVRHYIDDRVIAVSGGLKVRNEYENILCTLQSLEYRLAIELGRFGLSALNAMNIISGAFGSFRTSFLRTLGGWQNGAAEDLDLMMRLQAYTGRYPDFKIEYEPDAIAYTEVPNTLRALLFQRLRWEGDLYYIYVRRHWRKFSKAFMGRWKAFMMTWYGLYYQIALPFVFCLYYIYVTAVYDVAITVMVSLIIYVYYLLITVFLYALYLLLLSNNLKHDSRLIKYLIWMPIYQLGFRVIIAFFILNEILFKGHEDTTVAPYWITRKTK